MRRPLVRAAAIAVAILVSTSTAALVTFRSAAAQDNGVITLVAGQTKVITSTRPMGSSGEGAAGSSVPNDCRTDPQIKIVCDAYRIKLDLDTSPGALNFVRFELNWDTQRAPALALVVAGIVAVNVNDLDMAFFDISGAKPVKMTVDGAGAAYSVPEIASFEPTQAEYDLTIESTRGPNLSGYTLTAQFSNEKFAAPFEVLDPAANASFTPPVDRSGTPDVAPTAQPAPAADSSVAPATGFNGATAVAPAPAPLQADSDFTGFRGGVDNALTGNLAAFRTAAPTREALARAPSWAVVIFWLLVAPLILAAIGAWWLRRRSTA